MSEHKPDALTLLEVANKSSERLAVLHAGFMAACVYVLVIVFGTTDLDLLIGKGVQLPVVNVEVPIVGFYVLAPFILVLVHFNLLLQLQLLSRKLHAFDAAATPEEGELGGLRDRLHIFPFTYYIAGKPGPRVQPFVALMVSITVIMLPLITLLALQMVFLAYQEELYTWLQRIAIWIDIASVAYFWPLIIDPTGSLSDYYRGIYRAHLPRKRNWIPLGLFASGIILFLFGTESPSIAGMLLIPISCIAELILRRTRSILRDGSLRLALLILLSIFFLISLGIVAFDRVPVLFSFSLVAFTILLFKHSVAPRGSLALLLSIFLVFPLTLAMLVDGGMLERGITTMQSSHDRTTLFCYLFLKNKRTLELREQVLLAKQPPPETLALIRSEEWEKGIRQVEPLNLQGRKLRHADLYKCILVRADLREADLQGAGLSNSQLQGANLMDARLQGAYLLNAQLQCADLSIADLQGAYLSGAQLQGALLLGAQLQGADLSNAQLQGALLSNAQLQGALLSIADLQGALLLGAQLQGADLRDAQLQGAELSYAQLQGAYFRDAEIYGASFSEAKTELLDAREIVFTPMPDSTYVELHKELQAIEMYQERKAAALARVKKVTQPALPAPTFDSCLVSENTPIKCTNQLHETEYTKRLHAYLADLACSSPDIARGIIRQIKRSKYDESSSRIDLKAKLRERLKAGNCKGLNGLTDQEKRELLETSE